MSKQQRRRAHQKAFNNSSVKAGEIIDGISFYRPTSSGIYCIYPFASITNTRHGQAAVFKVGVASDSFHLRFQQYHTYFPYGIFIVSLLKVIPRAPHVNQLPTTAWNLFYSAYRRHLNEFEKRAFELLRENKGVIIKANNRTRNQSNTEWVYTTDEVIKRVFTELARQLNANPTYNKLYRFEVENEGQIDVQVWRQNIIKHGKLHTEQLLFDLSNKVLDAK